MGNAVLAFSMAEQVASTDKVVTRAPLLNVCVCVFFLFPDPPAVLMAGDSDVS